jgi:hypothetical protein
MANPRLQLRRGTQSPVAANVTTALVAEPFFDTSNDNLWIADGSSSFVHIGGATYTSRVDEVLTGATASVSTVVKLYEATDNGTNNVSIQAPTNLAADYTLTLPANDGDVNQVLTTDGNGVLSWSTAAVNSFTTISVSGQSDVLADQSGDTLTFAEGEGIDITTNPTTDTITISAELASTSNAGVASFSSDNFAVDGSGVVTIKDDGITLGTETTGNYVASVSTSSGITGGATGSEGATLSLSLDINGLTAESAIADADEFAFYDATASANRKATADNLRDYVLGGISGDITIDASGVASLAANSVALGTDTTGNYVADVTAGSGLTKSSSASEGQTVDLAVGAGTGITVNTDDVALKNADNLTNDTVMGWDSSNGQLENAPMTYSGNDVTVTGDLIVDGNDIKSNGGTTAITLDGANVTIAGNLTVSGSSTILNTETLKVEDRIIELGLIDGAAPTTGTTWDMAVAFNYFATTAKKSAIVWIDNAGFELAATVTETADTGNADPQITVVSRAALGIDSLYIGSIGTADNEVITSSKTIMNVTFDCGTY